MGAVTSTDRFLGAPMAQIEEKMSATTTLVGNATADFELRYTSAGRPVGNLTIAVSDRVKDQQTGEWRDAGTWFARCTIWGELAENSAKTITKGMAVIGVGRIAQRDFETKTGEKRTAVEVTLDALGPNLAHATAAVTRSQRPDSAQVGNHTDQWVSSSPTPGSAPQGPSSWGGQAASASPTDVWPSDSDSPF